MPTNGNKKRSKLTNRKPGIFVCVCGTGNFECA